MIALELAPTRRDTILRDGNARLLRFRRDTPATGLPILLVPSLINRWYVLDLRPGASVVQALLAAGLDVWCLDWGVPGDEDRDLDWDAIVERVGRAVRRVARACNVPRIGLLGYCMGGTLTAIHTALHPGSIAALVDLAGPIDFAKSGRLASMVDARWFDPTAMVAAGNLPALQMQAGFLALRPTTAIAKWVAFFDRIGDSEARKAFVHLEAWSSDNVAFPGAAYIRYIRDLYQRNELVAKQHHVRGERVDLRNIACPLLVVVASHDHICPAPAAEALLAHAKSDDARVLSVPGGHIGAVVGHNARTALYPELATWLRARLCIAPTHVVAGSQAPI